MEMNSKRLLPTTNRTYLWRLTLARRLQIICVKAANHQNGGDPFPLTLVGLLASVSLLGLSVWLQDDGFIDMLKNTGMVG